MVHKLLERLERVKRSPRKSAAITDVMDTRKNLGTLTAKISHVSTRKDRMFGLHKVLRPPVRQSVHLAVTLQCCLLSRKGTFLQYS